MTIVIDSNVWISALVFGGKPRSIIEKAVSNGWQIVTSEQIFTEVRRILQQKFPDFTQDFEDLLTVLKLYIVMVKLGSQPVAVSRDKNDDMVIETAIIGGATHIFTGDKDLLVISQHQNIKIVTPNQFIELC